MSLFALKNRSPGASRHRRPGPRPTQVSGKGCSSRGGSEKACQLIMSRPHGSAPPSPRRASATSLLNTDRFWVNLQEEEEGAQGSGWAEAAPTSGSQSNGGDQHLGEGPRSGWAEASSHSNWRTSPSQKTKVTTQPTLTILRGAFCGCAI